MDTLRIVSATPIEIEVGMALKFTRSDTPKAIARLLVKYAKTCERTAATAKRYDNRLRAAGRADAYYTAAAMVLTRAKTVKAKRIRKRVKREG